MNDDLPRIRSIEDAGTVIRSLVINQRQLEHRVRELEKMIDTKDTIWWRRIVFRIDGWSPWYHVDKSGPRPRPWRKWWTS